MSRREVWNERYAKRELIWSAGPNRLLAAEVANLEPATALDAACGEGRNALWLAEQGWQATGVDFSDVAIGKARRISAERRVQVNWVVADVARDELPDPGYDLVCVLYLHTDPAERERWLPRLIAAVNPGGTFVYVGHDPSNIEHGVGGPQKVELLPGPDAMTAALNGFRMDRAETVERAVDNDPGHAQDLSGIALDTFVRAVRPR